MRRVSPEPFGWPAESTLRRTSSTSDVRSSILLDKRSLTSESWLATVSANATRVNALLRSAASAARRQRGIFRLNRNQCGFVLPFDLAPAADQLVVAGRCSLK